MLIPKLYTTIYTIRSFTPLYKFLLVVIIYNIYLIHSLQHLCCFNFQSTNCILSF